MYNYTILFDIDNRKGVRIADKIVEEILELSDEKFQKFLLKPDCLIVFYEKKEEVFSFSVEFVPSDFILDPMFIFVIVSSIVTKYSGNLDKISLVRWREKNV